MNVDAAGKQVDLAAKKSENDFYNRQVGFFFFFSMTYLSNVL